MTDKESLIELRSHVNAIFTMYGFLFSESGKKLRSTTVGTIADHFSKSTQLYEMVSHRFTRRPIEVATPLLGVSANNFVECAVRLAAECKMLGDQLVTQIDDHEGRINFRVEQDYFRMFGEAAQTEINQAIEKIDNPKAKFPAFNFNDYMPSFFVLRSDLVNKGSKKGLLGISSGRLTQLQQRTENPFPRPIQVQGRIETYLLDEVEQWELRENERKKS